MQEAIPVVLGMMIGAGAWRLAVRTRGKIGMVLVSVVVGIGASAISGELTVANPYGFVLIDSLLAGCGAAIAYCALIWARKGSRARSAVANWAGQDAS